MKRFFVLLKTIAWYFAIVNSVDASQVTVIDAEGNPIPDVVFAWPTESAATVSEKPVVIDQIARQFVPHISAIHAGQNVDFPNSDNIRHHVYSFSESNPFEIKLYRNRPVEPIRFSNPGIVALGCNIHDQMIGYIYVAEPNSTMVTTNKEGVVQLPEINEVKYWHPRMSLTGSQIETLVLTGEPHQALTITLTPVAEDSSSTFGSGTFGGD